MFILKLSADSKEYSLFWNEIEDDFLRYHEDCYSCFFLGKNSHIMRFFKTQKDFNFSKFKRFDFDKKKEEVTFFDENDGYCALKAKEIDILACYTEDDRFLGNKFL